MTRGYSYGRISVKRRAFSASFRGGRKHRLGLGEEGGIYQRTSVKKDCGFMPQRGLGKILAGSRNDERNAAAVLFREGRPWNLSKKTY